VTANIAIADSLKALDFNRPNREEPAQRRLKPSTYAYRRKQGCDDKEREVQNTYHARKDARRNRFCAAPADPTLSEAGHQSLVPGEEKKQCKARRA